MKCQNHLFELDSNQVYLNCATKGPALKSVKEAGLKVMEVYSNPFSRKPDDFFKIPEKLKKSFSRLINLDDHERVAIVPSVSYGMANVVNNVKWRSGANIVVPDGQFPSNVYPWMAVAKEHGLQLKIVKAPDTKHNRGQLWNEMILDAIDHDTQLVSIGNLFWVDGTLFDLKAIRDKTKQYDALMIVDGTQSVGALPFDVNEIQPDALVCAGYKWLLGPYSNGLAYYSEYFDGGKPVEQNWYPKIDSDKFTKLVSYQEEFRSKAFRYSVGESSNFLLNPMLNTALDQILEWGVSNIQDYVTAITAKPIEALRENGFWVEDQHLRSSHLFGITIPEHMDVFQVADDLHNAQVKVSPRGSGLRVSPHVYNTEDDLWKLVEVLKG